MKNKIAFLLLFTLTQMAFSCEKDELQADAVDYFIFGEFHCFCNPDAGACASLYKYTPGSLIKGEGEACNLEEFTYETPSMDAADVAEAAALLEDVPDELYASKETTFGCPDCADQGGYYVSIKQKGKVKTWRIDTRTDDLPKFLVPFQQKLAAIINGLQQ